MVPGIGKNAFAALAAAVVLGGGLPAGAELNKFEAGTRGEFGIGSAAQYGSADLRCASMNLLPSTDVSSAPQLVPGRHVVHVHGFAICRQFSMLATIIELRH